MDATLNTDSGMLPQSRTLEAQAADKPGQARNALGQTAVAIRGNRARKGTEIHGVQHARGEHAGNASPASSRRKASADRQTGGVSPHNRPRRQQAAVFVLDRHGQPLMPTHPARARKMLKAGRARIHKLTPFTIRLIDRTLAESAVQPVRLKVDPDPRRPGFASSVKKPKPTAPSWSPPSCRPERRLACMSGGWPCGRPGASTSRRRTGGRPGDQRQALSPAVAGRWLWLRLPADTRSPRENGVRCRLILSTADRAAFLPDLKDGVSCGV